MAKKNYLTREEQKIWEYIKDKEIVDNELINEIFPEVEPHKRRKLLHSLYKKNYLNRARKDLYYNPEQLKDFHKIALCMREGYVGLSSALRQYNLIDYEDFTIFIITKTFQKKMELERTSYSIQFVPLHKLFTGFEKRDDMYISSVEKTLFDCLLKPGYAGYSNITKAIYDSKIDWRKFIYFFSLTKNSSLCQRTGYLLELMKKKTSLNVPGFVFSFLEKNVKHPVKLIALKGKSTFSRKWMVQDNIGEDNILQWWQ